MEVILIKDVKHKGKIGDKINVKLGYARNFLFAQNLALPASKQNLRRFEDLKNKELKAIAGEKGGAEASAKKIDGKSVTLEGKTHEGKLYGSITPSDVIKVIEENFGLTLKREQLDMPDHIKEAGEKTLIVDLHPEVSATMTLNITSDEEIEEPTTYEEALETQPEETPEATETTEEPEVSEDSAKSEESESSEDEPETADDSETNAETAAEDSDKDSED